MNGAERGQSGLAPRGRLWGAIGVRSTRPAARPCVLTQNSTVNLTHVTNAQVLTVTLSAVNDGTTTGDISVPMAVLLGDTNASGSVTASDIAQTKSQVGQTVTAANFREDPTANGSISASDVAFVKAQAGSALPPAPDRPAQSY